MGDFPWRLVTVDIDGTLTTEHGWWPIAVARGRVAAYERSRRALLAGREDEDTHLTRLFELAVGLRASTFERVLGRTHRVQGIRETLEALHARGARVALLSHNPGFVLRWYAKEFGFDGGSGGWGLTVRDGRIAPPARVRADKVRGLRALRRRFPVPPATICHVGDAWPDARLAPLVGGFLAFNPKTQPVVSAADAVVRSRDLRTILPVLDRMRPRRPVNGAEPLDEPSNTRARRTRPRPHGVRRPGGPASEVAEPPPPE